MMPLEGNMAGASKPSTVSPKQQRIAELAKQAAQMSFTSLAYHIDIDWLTEAYAATRKDGAAGVDEQTADEYGAKLRDNLQSLLDRAKSGTYFAPPVRRAYIPKGDGQDKRPIGIPTFEDKILQRAVLMLLQPIYEQDFRDCSHGFRPQRSAHTALQALWDQATDMAGGWIVEVDISKFFDTMDRAQLREFLQRRVRDGVVQRLIGKWLNAGVLDEGTLSYPEEGTPQGGVISPLLANIYLHYVLDEWFESEVKPRLKGRAYLIRYADDFVIGFENEDDARRVLEVLPKRFGKYGLKLHPEKTRLIDFRKPGSRGRDGSRASGEDKFDLLAFTHYWGKSRFGNWIIKRKTSPSRFSRALKKITDWCKRHRHEPMRLQHKTLKQKLHGHYGYFGITNNSLWLDRFQRAVVRVWHKWLCRRSWHSDIPWPCFADYLDRYPLPRPRVVHSVYRRAVKSPT
jgi:RNA-directed DNA polymerase